MATLLWQLDGENFPSEIWWIYCVTARNQLKMDGVHRIKFLKENLTPWLMNLAPSFSAKYWTKNDHVHCSAEHKFMQISYFGDFFKILFCCQSEKYDEAEAPINQNWSEATNYEFSLKWVCQGCRYKRAAHRRFLPSGAFNSVKFSNILPSIIAKTWLLPLLYLLGKFLGLQYAFLLGCK